MTYTFTENQLNALIYEIMELASAGVSFEYWAAEDSHNAAYQNDIGDWYDDDDNLIEDTWYFYPIEGDPFDIEDLNTIKQLTK